MAKLSSDKLIATVEAGDNLWDISQWLKVAHNININYQQIAAINDLPNPNLIYPGQQLKLKANTSTTTKTSSSDMVTILQFGPQASVENSYFASWSWDRESDTESYKVVWEIWTENKMWLTKVDYDTNYKYSTYDIPSEAKKVRFRVKPIAKTVKSGSTETAKFSSKYTSWKEAAIARPPKTPNSPTVTLDELKLTMTVNNVDPTASIVQFEVVKDNASKVGLDESGKVAVKFESASLTCNVVAGGTYKVRCRTIREDIASDWSSYSSDAETPPSSPGKLTKCEAASETIIHIEWPSVSNAKTYDVEYTTEKTSFDTSSNTTVISDLKVTSWDLTGIDSGQEYFFRVRASNDVGDSAWSEISSTVIGTGPAAPTTWSSTTTAIIGDPLSLYWVHNSRDGSSQTYAILELYFTGDIDVTSSLAASLIDPVFGTISDYSADSANKKITYNIKNSTNEEEKDKTSACSVNTSLFKAGVGVTWQVKTAGVTNICGEFSTSRIINIYDRPSLALTAINSEGFALGIPTYHKVNYTVDPPVRTDEILDDVTHGGPVIDVFTDTGEQVYLGTDSIGDDVYYCVVEHDSISSFPIRISAIAGPKEQAPIGYYLTVTANHSYETVDATGNSKVVNQGEYIYSQYFDISEDLQVELSAGDLNLENGVNYKIECSVSMDSGLTAENHVSFDVDWLDVTFTPNAEIGINKDSLTTFIRPYCAAYGIINYKVSERSGTYAITDEVINGVYGSPVSGIFTSTGEQVYYGTSATGESVYYCRVQNETFSTDVLLSVYRREFDGRFIELATNLDGAINTTIVDPHPALDYARYRIVSISKLTGSVGYYDTPGYPVQEKAIVIQWDEKWSNFDTFGESPDQPPWAGSLLKLPGNVDISDKHTPDVSLIEYIGRRNPVSYYGTQRGETSTWSLAIDKNDRETLYALRRLAIWPGDVYVREPSGSGYWATITVSFSQKHCEVTIPVNIEVTRVEGGA